MKYHTQSIIAILIFFLSSSFILNAQDESSTTSQHSVTVITAKNTFHLDFGALSTSLATNINYEFHLTSTESRTLQFSGRFGFGYIYSAGIFCGDASGVFGTSGLNILVGRGSHHLDVNLGGQFKLIGSEEKSGGFFRCTSGIKSFVPLLELGYRYQKPLGGLIFRAHIGSTGMAIGVGTAW